MADSTFAAAQERIIAQQAIRHQDAQSRRVLQEAATRNSSITQLPYPLSRAAPYASSVWTILVNDEGTRPAFRVGQVDAELLDEELLTLFRGQVGEGLKFWGAHLQDDWSKEISLILRAALFKLSIWDNNASYGASLQNLRYSDARQQSLIRPLPAKWQKVLLGLYNVFGRYGWEKWENWLTEQEGGYTTPSETLQNLSRLTSWFSTTHSIAAFGSFLIFLINGRYRTLADRLLRLRLVPASTQVNREVSFEYLNRQLVWHAFTEFLLFLLPLVGISRWRRWLSRAWKRTKAAVRSDAQAQATEESVKTGPLAFLPERTCAICYQDQNPASSEAEILGANTGAGGGVIGSATTDIVNPYETIPCGSIYCFTCIATKIEGEEGSGWTCLRCGENILKCKPWDGGVLVEKKQSSKTTKSVGFSNENVQQNPAKDFDEISHPELADSIMQSSQWSSVEPG